MNAHTARIIYWKEKEISIGLQSQMQVFENANCLEIINVIMILGHSCDRFAIALFLLYSKWHRK